MSKDKSNKDTRFNNVNERKGMDEEFEKEQNASEDQAKTNDEMSTGNSIRNFGEVSGSTFGSESNTSKFSNIGRKNQEQKGEWWKAIIMHFYSNHKFYYTNWYSCKVIRVIRALNLCNCPYNNTAVNPAINSK